VRRLRSVFGSGRTCRNSYDFRQPCARRGASCLDRRPVTRGAHHRATPVCTAPARPWLLLLSHAPVASRPSRPRHRLTRLNIMPSPQTPPFSHIVPYAPAPHRGPRLRPTHLARPRAVTPAPARANRTNATPKFAANLFLQPVTPSPITASRQPPGQAGSVSRVFRVRCRLVTC
jgi:hypothetical protein